MIQSTLKREKSDDKGTLGVLSINGDLVCQSLELPWLANRSNISCIPDGSYTCKRIDSPHFGNVFQIMNVKDREHVLLHKGNFLRDTHGCVLLGMHSGEVNGQYCIYKSKDAFDRFMTILKDCKSFQLEILSN